MRFASLIFAALAAGCGTEPLTAVDVTIDADACVAANVRRLDVRVLDATGREQGMFDVTDIAFPTGVRVKAIDPDGTWRVTARAYDEADMLIGELDVTGSFTPSSLVTRRAVFQNACYGVACSEGRVCRGGRCDRATGVPFEPAELSASCPEIVWVDGTSGTDGMDCLARTAPCRTLQHALTTHASATDAPGALVFVRGGARYTGAGPGEALTLAAGGSVEHPLTLRAWPGTGVPTIDGERARLDVIDVNAANVVLDGFELTGGTEHAVQLNGEHVHDVSVLRCEIHGNGSATMTMYPNRAGVVINNGASNLLIAECEIRDNRNPLAEVSGVWAVDGTGAVVRNLVVADCAVHANTGPGVRLSTSEAALVDNRIFDNDLSNVFVLDAGVFDARNNAICDAGSHGILVQDAAAVTISNNTIVGSTEVGASIGAVPSAALVSNIFLDSGGAGIRAGGSIDDSFNLYFGNASEAMGFTRSMPDTDVVADPMLVAGGEPCSFALGPTSPARGAAADGGDIGARR